MRVVHHGLLRVCVVAVTRIAPGDQILVDYGDAYWRASGVRPRALPRCLADIGPADWNPIDDLASEPDLRGFAEWYASEADNEDMSRWFPRDAGTPGLRRRVALLWLRRCQRWIKNELYHPFKDLKKTARLRALARRVELYCIAWRGDVETSIRINEADAIAARAMLGLPPATPADELADEIATLSI